MRKIKFRYVYQHDETGRIATPVFTIEEIEKNDCRDAFLRYGLLVARNQFIGLKDKNGKEIYEGDIVKYDYWSATGTLGKIGEVSFDAGKGAFGVEYADGEFHYFGAGVYQHACEITGNIYENFDYSIADMKIKKT